MVVPYIRNPNRARRDQNAKTSTLNYHQEPEYYRLGRRTKGSYTGVTETQVWIILLSVFVPTIALRCFLSHREHRRNRRNIQNARNSVYQRRSMRNLHTTNTATNAYSLQFHTQEPQANESPNTYQSPSDLRHEKMLQNFKFQTVLPDKSNATASALRKEQGDTGSDDDSVIEKPNQDRATMNKGTSYKLSSGFLMSTWRRPTKNDECSICLDEYDAGQTICVATTTSCDHIFHEDCIEEWLKDHDNCPMCRVNLMNSAPTG
jgi:hypothetical protein